MIIVNLTSDRNMSVAQFKPILNALQKRKWNKNLSDNSFSEDTYTIWFDSGLYESETDSKVMFNVNIQNERTSAEYTIGFDSESERESWLKENLPSVKVI